MYAKHAPRAAWRSSRAGGIALCVCPFPFHWTMNRQWRQREALRRDSRKEMETCLPLMGAQTPRRRSTMNPVQFIAAVHLIYPDGSPRRDRCVRLLWLKPLSPLRSGPKHKLP